MLERHGTEANLLLRRRRLSPCIVFAVLVLMLYHIQIIAAPSILGLKPSGVEQLADSLLAAGLAEKLSSKRPVIQVPGKNIQYNTERDTETKCLNPLTIHTFSLALMKEISQQVKNNNFSLVLGGDCSILIGIMPALKMNGKFGLVFIDAHADFYDPSQSTTGEVADMDLAIVTGRGPDILANIHHLKPYVKDEHVIHIAQRDAEETEKYGSRDIRDTNIRCFDLERIRKQGLYNVMNEILDTIGKLKVDGFWIHFDTDVLSDEENPAVDYHLPGGLSFSETNYILTCLLATNRMAGMSVTIFNPTMDTTGKIAVNISNCIASAFKSKSSA